jgi:hypothetical protein
MVRSTAALLNLRVASATRTTGKLISPAQVNDGITVELAATSEMLRRNSRRFML